MIVTFYETKLSANNRCYDKAAYESYLQGCKQRSVTIDFDIIPNANFYLPAVSATDKWQLYNYITFEYAGLKYGSFILSIQPLATDGTIEIRHTTDNWYYILVNSLNVDFHGQCVRAHVNDILKNSYGNYIPTLKNTVSSAEEGIPTTKAKMSTKNIEDYSEEALFVHIFFNNPTFRTVNIDTIESSSQTDHKKYQNYFDEVSNNTISSISLSCFGILNVKTGEISFDGIVKKRYIPFSGTPQETTLFDSLNLGTDTESHFYDRHSFMLADLSSNLITGISVSNVPPNQYTTIEKHTLNDGRVIYRYNYTKTFYNETLYNNVNLADILYSTYNPTFENPNLPRFMPISVECRYHYLSTFAKGETSSNRYMPDKFYEIYTGDTIITEHITSNYDNYIKYGIIKANTSIYNPIYICDTFILSTQLSSLTDIIITYSPDFTFKRYSPLWKDLEEQYARSIQVQNMGFFPPDTTYSMWDRLSALQTAYSADQKVVNAQYNVHMSYLDIAGSVVSGSTGSKYGAMVNFAKSALSSAQKRQQLEYTRKDSELTKKIAWGQYNEGNIKNYPATGYYEPISKNNTLTFIYLEEEDILPVKINLHRFGYNTILQLDDVYKNHRRRYFNYIQTEDCDVNGVPLDIAQDIEEMFNSGVHLWSGEVENWEVPNWQNNVEVQNV